MNIIKSHNDYKIRPARDQIFKSIRYFRLMNELKLESEGFHAVMPEADIIWLFGECRLAHSWTLLPWRIYGTFSEYVEKAQKLGIRFMQVEFKTNDIRCAYQAQEIARDFPDITFVWLYKCRSLTDKFIHQVETMATCKYAPPNIYDYDLFYSQNVVTSVDLY